MITNLHNNIQEVEVFFPVIIQKELIQTYLESDFFWRYSKAVTFPKDTDNEKLIKNYLKSNRFVDTEAFMLSLDLNEKRNERLINNIKHYTYRNFNVKINSLFRIQFAFVPANPLFDEELTLFPHIDWEFPHKTLLYYVLDNDAETIFYNKTYQANTSLNSENYFKDVDIMHRVQPKQGKAVLFDGFIFHAGNVSKKTRRITLNINFI